MNEVTAFMFYMYNKWNIEESIKVFGQNLGEHIYRKWQRAWEDEHDSNLWFYSQLDSACRSLLVERANFWYNHG